jgi:farnesyl diphosphate synthase
VNRAQSPADSGRYAESIGLAFQVQDDILDVVGDTATLGKRQGADQQLGKSTYPALWVLSKPNVKPGT